jgi:hypothetical protein
MTTKRIVIELNTDMDDKAFEDLARRAVRELTEELGEVSWKRGCDLSVLKTHITTIP